MVWFQCEDCGENLKKPKVPNHFRVCSAYKLSCIDCGEIFNRESVQGHNQCITEAEKYGPKGQVKSSNGSTPKANADAKTKPEVDINVGLSDRPPWFCSLCNTKATSKQTLLLHADGKKHRAKARAFHAAQQPKQPEVPSSDANATNECKANGGTVANGHVQEQNAEDTTNMHTASANLEVENGKLSSMKKRKLEALGNYVNGERTGSDEVGNNMVQVENEKEDEVHLKRPKQNVPGDDKLVVDGSKDSPKKKIKWKKLIKSAFKSNPDGALKLKKLKKIILKSLKESGITEDITEFENILEQKVNSCSRFKIDGKYVHLVAKD